MNPRRLFLAALVAFCACHPLLLAAAPDVSGAWHWQYERNGQSMDIAMKIKQEGSKVSGQVTAPEISAAEIREGRITGDGNLTFFLNIERDGNTIKINFEGQASGDTITGKTKYINSQGEERERDWLAKRAAQPAALALTGEWKSSFKRQDGTAMESTLHLKQNGEKLAGKSVSANGNETELQDGKIQGTDVSFKIVRDRDGRAVTAKYRGKLQEDHSIKGSIDSDWTGEVRKLDWEAKKAK